MSDKLEALKAIADEIAPGYRQEWGCEDGANEDSISVGTYNDDGDICPFIDVSISDWSGNDDDNEKLAKFITLANPPVVSELLAALEEKDQKIEAMKTEAEGSNQRTQMIFEAKNHWAERARAAEQRLQQPIKLPKGFSHQDGAPHALLGTGDVMISHIKWDDAQGIAFAPMPAGKAGIGVNVDADVAGKSSDEIGAVFVVKATSVQSLEVLKEAVQMAIDGFKVEGE